MKIGDKEYKLSDFDTCKEEVIEELENAEYDDLKDMVFRVESTYHEVADIPETKTFDAKSTGYTFPPGIYEISDINLMLKTLRPNDVKVKITFVDNGLRSNLTTNKAIRFTKRSFFYTKLGFVESNSGVLCFFPGFVRLTPGSYKSDKPINITGVDKIHLKADCIHGSVVNGRREAILYSFAVDSPPGHKIYKSPKKLPFKKLNESVLSHITF